jgi:hypothetical protein
MNRKWLFTGTLNKILFTFPPVWRMIYSYLPSYSCLFIHKEKLSESLKRRKTSELKSTNHGTEKTKDPIVRR